MMHLRSTKIRGDISLRRYEHDRHGTIETLRRGSLVVVRPVFGPLKSDKQQQREVARSRTQKSKVKRRPRLGRMWANRKERRIAPDKKAVIGRNSLTGRA